MVKKISELYQDARHALLVSEDAQTAGMMARNLLCMATGKTPEQLVADREMYASQEACDTVRKAVERLQEGEPLEVPEWTPPIGSSADRASSDGSEEGRWFLPPR